MININLGNIIGATTSIQGESTSTDSLSTWSDFIGEFELSLENNGDISNKIEGVDEGLILYNFIYTLYQKLNIQENIGTNINLETIESKVADINMNLEFNSDLNELLPTEVNKEVLQQNSLQDILDFINNYTNENKDILEKNTFDENISLIVNKIKEHINKSDDFNKVTNFEKLDSIGAYNMSKIDDYTNLKNEDKDIDCLENILSSDDNNYTGVINGFNKFNTIYNTNTNNSIEQPVSEIRQEFIVDDLVKAVDYIKSNDMESLNVKFNPKDLGEISINISKNDEESNLLITVDNDNAFDIVNKNIEDIKNHLKESNINLNDVVVTVKSNDENLLSDSLNRGFNKEGNFNQGKNNKYKKDNKESIEDITISNQDSNDDNLNILI